MIQSKHSLFKRSLAGILTLSICAGMAGVTSFAEDSEAAVKSMTEKYTVPIASLVSAAPLEPVKTAFAKAFGESVSLVKAEDGSETAYIKNQHMVIDLFGSSYEANVSSIVDADESTDEVEAATVISTKQETYSKNFGDTTPVDIEVPDEFSIPLSLDENNAQKISITVDFMDAFLGGGSAYPTTVTLTLDMDNAVLDTTELKTLADEYRAAELTSYTDESAEKLTAAISDADKLIESGGTYEEANSCYTALQNAYQALTYKSADYTKVDEALKKVPEDLSGYTYKSAQALRTAVDAVGDRSLNITEQEKVDELAAAIEEAVMSLEEALVSSAGSYIVPIKSLTSAAPLEPVQTAFAKAFGESVTVVVAEDGSKTAYIKNQHMVIDLWGMATYDANVSAIVDADMSAEGTQDATIISTKQETYTNASQETVDITVPDEFSIPLNLDENASQKISITVDFMDSSMGNGEPYPMTITLTLDMDNAVIDVSELEALISEYEAITGENYTEESFAAFESTIAKAKEVAENPETMEKYNAAIADLKDSKDCLTYKDADYSAVDAAIEKIPADSTIYTEESWTALETAKNAVVNGLTILEQETVDAYAAAIEAAVSALVLADADYSLVDQAIASVPEDMSGYTDESVQRVNEAVAAVERELKADKQTEVNAMATAITQAVAALEKKAEDNPSSSDDNIDNNIDVSNLSDGVYEIPVALWHATEDRASMAASSLNGTARILVKDGNMTVYIYTQPMTFGTITASLQEMKVEQSDGSLVEAVAETTSDDGNPTSFSFALDKLSEYVSVKVNPHVEMMGNQDLDARLKFSLDEIKLLSSDTSDMPSDVPDDDNSKTDNNTSDDNAKTDNNTSSTPNTTNSNTQSSGTTAAPSTGDESNLMIMLGVFMLAAVSGLVIYRKRKSL